MLIREGRKEDLASVFVLIQELADYENAPDAVETTLAQMEIDGFGENPIYGFFVAENDKKAIVGTSIYYFRYSTWQGKKLYLEDLIVTESERGNGIGKLLFDKTVEKASTSKCTGMSWQVLDWNEPAINFYKKYAHTSFDGEWINCSLKLA